jgi:hypothetical protein
MPKINDSRIKHKVLIERLRKNITRNSPIYVKAIVDLANDLDMYEKSLFICPDCNYKITGFEFMLKSEKK